MNGRIESAATPDAAPQPQPQPQPVRRRRIDWKRGATLLVEGGRPAEVAAALGIDEDRLWKHLHHSLRFAVHIWRAMDRRRLLAQIQYDALPGAVIRHCQQETPPDGAHLQWLTAVMPPRTGTGLGPDDTAPDPVDQLRATGGRYPSQALRKRLAAEKAEMDAFVAASREMLARHIAANPLPAEVATQSAPIAPDKTQITPDKTPIASDKTQITPDKTQTASDKTPIAPDKAPRLAAAGVSLPLQPRAARRDHRPPPPNPTIVDLTDIYGRPLPGAVFPDEHPG